MARIPQSSFKPWTKRGIQSQIRKLLVEEKEITHHKAISNKIKTFYEKIFYTKVPKQQCWRTTIPQFFKYQDINKWKIRLMSKQNVWNWTIQFHEKHEEQQNFRQRRVNKGILQNFLGWNENFPYGKFQPNFPYEDLSTLHKDKLS